MSLTKSVKTKLAETHLFLEGVLSSPRDRIVVAFSGGPDSTALLLSVLSCGGIGTEKTVAAYFDHRLRGENESAREILHARQVTDQLGVRLVSGSSENGAINAFSAKNAISIEEAARIARYRFLRATADEFGCSFVATGHTKDDLVETLVQRFFQGSGVAGLKGIPRVRSDIIRPILTWTREDVTGFVSDHGVESFEDPSNHKDMYLRNKIRHTISPAAEMVFPGYRRSIGTLADKMALAHDYIVAHMARGEQWRRDKAGIYIPSAAFARMHPLERIEAVSAEIDCEGGGESGTVRLPFGGFRDLICLPELVHNRILYRGGGMRVQVRGDRVFLERDIVIAWEKGYFTVVKERCSEGWSEDIAFPGIRVSVVAEAADSTAFLPAESIEYPLIIRSRRGGDAIHTAGSTKDLKKLFNEWNVPSHIKWKIAVCEDRKGIVAVFGSLFGFKDVKRSTIGTSTAGNLFAFALR